MIPTFTDGFFGDKSINEKSAELSNYYVWNCHGKSELKPFIRAMLARNDKLGAKHARFGAFSATYWLIINYNENIFFLNEETRCLLKKA